MKRGATAFLLGLALAAAVSSNAHAIRCKSAPETAPSGGQPSEVLAREVSRQTWVAMVTVKFGPVWSNFALARDPTWLCSEAPSGVGTYVSQCMFRARACRL